MTFRQRQTFRANKRKRKASRMMSMSRREWKVNPPGRSVLYMYRRVRDDLGRVRMVPILDRYGVSVGRRLGVVRGSLFRCGRLDPERVAEAETDDAAYIGTAMRSLQVRAR